MVEKVGDKLQQLKSESVEVVSHGAEFPKNFRDLMPEEQNDLLHTAGYKIYGRRGHVNPVIYVVRPEEKDIPINKRPLELRDFYKKLKKF